MTPPVIKMILLKARALFGSGEAMSELATYYMYGVWVEADAEKAIDLIKKAAEKGSEFAQNFLKNSIETDENGKPFIPMLADEELVKYMKNVIYYSDKGDAIAQWMRGFGKLSDECSDDIYQRGLYWVGLSAKQKFPPAMFALAYEYLSGKRVQGRQDEGLALLHEAAEAGDEKAIRLLSTINPEATFTIARRLAVNGDPNGMMMLSSFYLSGVVVEKNEAKALEYQRQAAEKDNETALFNMGICYENGWMGLPKDFDKAISYFERCIEKHKSADAMNELGSLLSWSNETEYHDMPRAFELFSKAANEDDANGYNNLAHFYKHGFVVDKDPDKALQLYQQAAEKGCLTAYANIVRLYTDDVALPADYDKADQWLQKGAEAGDEDCLMISALHYRDGYRHKQDLPKAFDYFQQAAEKNNADAFVNLGLMYRYGAGTEIDHHKAFEYFQKAADANHTHGIACLGQCYTYAIGTEKDDKKAAELYRIAAERGDDQAQLDLGICCRFGEGIKQDFEKARHWYQKAIDQDNANAMLNMGVIYDTGLGVDTDHEKAFYYFSMAAERGNADAQCLVGRDYINGIGTAKNEAEGVKWLQKAAEQGEPDSMYQLAQCYYNGTGVEQDETIGYRYLLESAKRGWKEAVEAIEENNVTPQNYHF